MIKTIGKGKFEEGHLWKMIGYIYICIIDKEVFGM